MRKDNYQEWKEKNELNSKLETIKKLAGSGVSINVIADKLGISRRTFISLKNKYKVIEEAYETGKETFKGNLIEAMVKRALGFKITDEDQYIEETSRGTRKRIVKHIKEMPPDIAAMKYLLVTHFGRKFSEKKYELELMEKRIEKGIEEWTNADSHEEDK